MFLFRVQKTKIANAQGPTEIPQEFADYIRNLKNQGEITSKPSSLPLDIEKWQSALLKMAGNSKDKYFAILTEIINSSLNDFDYSDKYVAGFLYGHRLNMDLSDFLNADKTLNKEALKMHFFDFFNTNNKASDPAADVASQGASLAAELLYNAGMVKQSVVFKKQKTEKKNVGPNTDMGRVTTNRPVEYAQVPIPQLLPISFEQPPAIFVASNFPGANKFQKTINAAVSSLGGIADQDQGEFRNFPPKFVSPSEMVKYKQTLHDGFELWLNEKYTDRNGIAWPSVEAFMKSSSGDLSNPGNFEKFKTALENGQFKEAISYLKKNSPTYNALGTSVETSQNIATVLDRRALALLLDHSFSVDGAVTYKLNNSGNAALQVYVRYDGTVLVTNEVVNTITTGMRLLANINPTDTKLVFGAGAQFSKTNEPEWYVEVGADQKIPIAGYVSGIVRGGLSIVMGPQHTPIYGGNFEVGVKADTPKFSSEITFSKAFSPGMADDQQFLQDLYVQTKFGYKISTSTILSLSVGTIADFSGKKSVFTNPISGNVPWYIKLGVSVTLP